VKKKEKKNREDITTGKSFSRLIIESFQGGLKGQGKVGKLRGGRVGQENVGKMQQILQ